MTPTRSAHGAMLRAPNLDPLPGIRHGFCTRRGGVSEGPFESLNCGFSGGDEQGRVEANRATAMQWLGMSAGSLRTARQVHGIAVLTVRRGQLGPAAEEADALVTDRAGVTVGVLSADCVPVLIADPEAGVVAAVHAGWRSALAGVVEATVAAMVALGARPQAMSAAIGPCIAQASYEVGPELRQMFVADDPATARLFRPVAGSDRLLLDLERHVLGRLGRAGVPDALGLAEDTHADPARFFSARRTRQAGGSRFGLLLSVIGLTG